ncbi:MAG: hypothetical protein LBE55_02755 [Clostridiales bacterium]|jgi:hypothetical protein|nr:hypothetical protein [Clostridiales bacterium]
MPIKTLLRLRRIKRVATVILALWLVAEIAMMLINEGAITIRAPGIIIPFGILVIIRWVYTYTEHRHWVCRSCHRRLPEVEHPRGSVRLVRPPDFTATSCPHCNARINYED